jgi:hypothetical protein
MLTHAELQARRKNAIGFLLNAREPHALLFMDIIYRRFGVDEFSIALARYEEVLADHPDAPKLRVLRRIADADNPIEPDDWDHVTFPKDRILVSALYCDRLGLPDSFADVLARAASQGGYALTHALLAWTWVQENGCKLEVPDGFVDQMYDDVQALIDSDPTVINDLKLEAGAFLCLARQSSRVDLRFVQRVIAIQNADGGWGRPDEGAGNPDESSWHSTILALILLLHVEIPDSPLN